LERSLTIANEKHGPEQIVTKLRQIEVLQGQGKSIAAACKEAGTPEQSYYRWPKEYGGLNVDQAKRLKHLETENGRLKKLVADLSLEKQWPDRFSVPSIVGDYCIFDGRSRWAGYAARASGAGGL